MTPVRTEHCTQVGVRCHRGSDEPTAESANQCDPSMHVCRHLVHHGQHARVEFMHMLSRAYVGKRSLQYFLSLKRHLAQRALASAYRTLLCRMLGDLDKTCICNYKYILHAPNNTCSVSPAPSSLGDGHALLFPALLPLGNTLCTSRTSNRPLASTSSTHTT